MLLPVSAGGSDFPAEMRLSRQPGHFCLNGIRFLAIGRPAIFRKRVDQTGTRPTLEYIIFKDFNDSLEDARELAEFCKNFPTKINIIEYNPIDGGEFRKADIAKTDKLVEVLLSSN